MTLKHIITGFIATCFLSGTVFVANADDTAQVETETSFTTSETALGTLLDDPETRAVLEAHVAAELFDNPQVAMARGMTLRQLQMFASDVLSDEVLAAIDADLANLTS